MATSENYLTSIKCWFEPHGNLKEGEKIEDERAKCQGLAWQPRNATRQAPVLGLPESSGLCAAAAATSLVGFGESLSSVI